MKKITLALVLPLMMSLSACMDNIGADYYNTSAAGQVSRAVRGTIVAVRPVIVSDGDGQFGQLAGAAAGGVAGSMIGGSDAVHILGAIGGAVIGGIAGDAAQEGLSRQQGYEYTIQLDNGNLVSLVQGKDVILHVGQKCLVLYGNRSRVVPYNGY